MRGGLPPNSTGRGEESVHLKAWTLALPTAAGECQKQRPCPGGTPQPRTRGGESPVCKVWLWGGQDIFRPYCEHLLCLDCARMINTVGDQPRRNKCFTCQCWWWGYWTAPDLPTETCKPKPRDQKRDPDRDDDDHSGRGGHNQATAC